LTHPGLVRPDNEDQYFVTRLTRTLETMLTSVPASAAPARADEVNYVMVVADGMGGHAAGEVASRMAISALARLALDLPDWHFRVDPDRTSELAQRTRHIVEQIDAELIEEGHQDEALHGMGTTLTGARSFGRDLMIAHVGDSRVYLLRGNRLRRLTRDHTYAQLLVDTGQLRATDAATSRTRHILTNVLGGSDAHVEVEIDTLQLEEGDRLLLCSDGLTDLVDDDTIATALLTHPTSAAACAHLVQLALDHGGRDNVTVIVAGYHCS
jgi:serine/threonine protein phosphatase PrpC